MQDLPLGDQIRERLEAYLGGDIPLDEFEDWFVGTSWNIDQTGDTAAIDLAYEIDLRLLEYANGDRTEGDLRSILSHLATTIVMHHGPLGARTGSEARTITPPLRPLWSFAAAGT